MLRKRPLARIGASCLRKAGLSGSDLDERWIATYPPMAPSMDHNETF